MKKIIVFFSTFVILLSALTVPIHAEDFSDFSDNTVANNIDNAAGFFGDTLRTSKKLLNGEITVPDAVGEITSSAASHGIDIASSTIGDIINGDFSMMSPFDAAKYLVNAVRNELKNSGADISNFPIGGDTIGRYSLPGGGYIDFYQVYSTDFDGSYRLNYSVYYADGTLAKKDIGPRSYTTHSPAFSDLTFLGLRPVANYPDFTYVNFDISIYDPYPTKKQSNFDVLLPWSLTGDPTEVTETPNVDNLTDDELLKYIDNIIDNLEKTYPDLSTLEGKLQEILNKMDKLGNGCNCAELAASINALLDYLRKNGGNSDNTELNNTLTELNNTLKNDIDLKPIQDKLDKIYNVLKNIYYELGDDYTVDKAKQDVSDSFDELKKKIEDKFHITTIKNSIDNFSNAIFGKAAFENDKETGQLMVASVYGDGSRSVSDVFYPLSLEIEYEGKKYDLFKWSGFIPATTMSTFRGFVRFILWITFLIGLFRSIPGMLGGFDQLSAPIDRELSKGFNDGYKNG